MAQRYEYSAQCPCVIDIDDEIIELFEGILRPITASKAIYSIVLILRPFEYVVTLLSVTHALYILVLP